MLLALYIAASIVESIVRPWLNVLHPKTDSDRIALLSIEVGIATALLVVIQIFIALRQVDLQKTELCIIDRQDQMLNRTENLELSDLITMNSWPGHSYDMTFQLELVNQGKSVQGAWVHIFLEQYDGMVALVLSRLTLFASIKEEWTQAYPQYVPVPGGNSYNLTEYRKWFDVLLPGEGRKTMFPTLVLHVAEKGNYRFYWAVQTLNGWFPKDRRFATIELQQSE